MLFQVLLLTFILSSFCLQSNEIALSNHLLTSHSRFARPVLNTSKPVVVTFGFELIHIISVQESEQSIKVKVWMRMSWVNELLRWDPKQWGGINVTRFDYNSIWTPDLFLIEDIDKDQSGPESYKTPIICQHDGNHKWLIPALLESSCDFDVQNFPYDLQRCYFKFTSWTHDKTGLDLKKDTRPVITLNYIHSPEWEFISMKSTINEKMYECCPNPYVDILYTLVIDRRSLYYIFNAIVPCVIQMIIILFTFFLPPESGERIGVVITVLLVFAVYLEIISSSLPKTSHSIPALSFFYITAMATSSCSLLATCLILVIHFKGSQTGTKPVPRWARTLFIDRIARFIGVHSTLSEYNDRELHRTKEKEEYTEIYADHKELLEKISDEASVGNGNCHYVKKESDKLYEEVRAINEHIQCMNREDEIAVEWETLAKVFDRLFFFLFVLIFLVSSLLILLPVSIAKHHH